MRVKSILLKVIPRVLVFVLCGLIMLSSFSLDASAPYITRTVNRYDEIVETQGAYDPIKNIKTFEHDGVFDTFKTPKDLFIDSEDYFYVCDTGNKRIVILDKDWNYQIGRAHV